jgi:hypothetical protein
MKTSSKFTTLNKRQNIDAGLTVAVLQHKQTRKMFVLANIGTVKPEYARAGSYCREIWKLVSSLQEACYVAGLMLDNPWPIIGTDKPDPASK